MIIVGILIVLLVFLGVVLAWIALPPILDYIRRKMPVSQKRIDRRYVTIDSWLISKRVRPHDECCDMLIAQLSVDPQKYCQPCTNSSSDTISKRYTFSAKQMLTKLASIHLKEEEIDRLNKSKRKDDPETQLEDIHRETKDDGVHEDGSESTFDDDNDDLETMNKKCGICLEKFKVGEAVSWSCDEGCQHVFHHGCLRNWLLRRIRCPYCRTIVLPVDKPKESEESSKVKRRLFGGEKFTADEMYTMASQRANYLTRTYFCVQNGLVVLLSLKDAEKSISSTSHTSATVRSESKVGEKPSSDNENNTLAEPKRTFLFWKRKRQESNDVDDENDQNGSGDDVLNTTRSLCSEDTFGDADSTDGGKACGKSDFNGSCRTLRMGSSSTDAFGSVLSDDDDCEDDLEAPDADLSCSQSEMEHGFGSICRTDDDYDYDESQRSSSSSSSFFHNDLVSSQRTKEHNTEGGLDIVRLDL